MAVSEQTPYIEYTANGSTTTFALGFICSLKDELHVLINNVEQSASTWSLTNNSVSFNAAPSNGSKVTLYRETKLKRVTDYSSANNSFRPSALNAELDRVWFALQDQLYKLNQYDFDYSYAINTSNQALSNAATAQQKADSAYNLADTVNTETRPIERGGTGASTAEDARTNLNVYSQAEVDALIATGGESNVVGVAGGGTGATTVAEARTNLGVMSSTEVENAINSATPQSTETALGVAKIATTAIAQAGVNDTDIITSKKLADYFELKSIGINQTYQKLAVVAGTTYTNTSLSPIFVYIKVIGVSQTSGTTVNGVVLPNIDMSSGWEHSMSASYIIPPLATYSFRGQVDNIWSLR